MGGSGNSHAPTVPVARYGRRVAVVAIRAFRGTPGQPCVPQIAWYLLVQWPISVDDNLRFPSIDGYYALELKFDGKYGWWPDDWSDEPWPVQIPRGESEECLG